MSHIYMPTKSPEDWKQFLAEPAKQWKTGYSAKALAYSWQEANGFPAEIKQMFATSEHSLFQEIELLLAIPELKTPLPGGARPSQTDLFVLAGSARRLVVIGVEGKVSEPFGPTVEEWLRRPTPGKQKRLAFLCDTLGLDPAQVSSIRYQLLHRTVAALLEARRFRTGSALMLVHSFSQEHAWFEDYADFLALFGLKGKVDALTRSKDIDGPAIYFGWVTGDHNYLEV